MCRTTIEEGLESSQPALLVRNLSLSMVEGTVHFAVVKNGFIPTVR